MIWLRRGASSVVTGIGCSGVNRPAGRYSSYVKNAPLASLFPPRDGRELSEDVGVYPEDRMTPPEAAMKRLIALLVVLLIVPTVTLADGFIIINPGSSAIAVPRGHFPFAPLEVTYHRVSVEINDQVAVTSVDQEFYNPNPQQLQGTYLFPLSAGALIDK